MLIVGLALVAAGAAGLVVVAGDSASLDPAFSFRATGTDASLGERIYMDGIGEDGFIPRSAVGPGMMGGGCAVCHGTDGRGGTFTMMMGRFEAPDIRYDVLTGEHAEEGEHAEHGGWSDEDIRRAIEDGIEPDGKRLDPFMPRWEMTDEEFDALLGYLKELSER
ncbi:MAG: hypothetical protein Kow0056_05200 [Coriobacteriia bacterium]